MLLDKLEEILISKPTPKTEAESNSQIISKNKSLI